ncbi:EamA family transporter RarD [Oceanobacter mangrovi]|uniref:EamA family transporter RarD n=1 Tax=Oceanobacter mangrovi TaxID=2862510 RepID=UPI001C8EF092|nr:EamA family transporter RarD [Oceanobacter mangrovi]
MTDSVTARATTAAGYSSAGIWFAMAAYGLWGLFPVYFKWLENVPAFEVLLHRVVWSVGFLLLLVLATRRGKAFLQVLRQPKLLASLALSAVLMAANWLVFIWAVANERILETSLGYFLNPLISIFLGMVFLSERLRKGQWLALGLATFGVLLQVIVFGSLPLVALGVSFSFGLYGLMRKRIAIESILGLFVETLILLPLALIYMWWLQQHQQLVFLHADNWHQDTLLLLSGVVTSVPLLLFAAAARRLPLMMMGFLQYSVPTISFALAVLVYDEPVDSAKLMTFVIIWIALLVFTVEGIRSRRLKMQASKNQMTL